MSDFVWLTSTEYHENKPADKQGLLDVWADTVGVGGIFSFGYGGEAFWIRYWVQSTGKRRVCRVSPCQCAELADDGGIHPVNTQRMLLAGETPPQFLVEMLMAKMKGGLDGRVCVLGSAGGHGSR